MFYKCIQLLPIWQSSLFFVTKIKTRSKKYGSTISIKKTANKINCCTFASKLFCEGEKTNRFFPFQFQVTHTCLRVRFCATILSGMILFCTFLIVFRYKILLYNCALTVEPTKYISLIYIYIWAVLLLYFEINVK